MGKKEKIIQSAIELFQEQGIEKTTVSHIVKRANIAQGTFYLYFPSKLSLMPAIAEEMVKVLVERMNEAIPKDTSIEKTLKKIIDTIFSFTKEYREVLAIVYSGLAATEHLKEWETVYAPCYELISNLIKKGIEAGEIETKLHPRRIAKLAIGLVESATEQVFLYDYSDTYEVGNQKEAVTQFLFAALHIAP